MRLLGVKKSDLFFGGIQVLLNFKKFTWRVVGIVGNECKSLNSSGYIFYEWVDPKLWLLLEMIPTSWERVFLLLCELTDVGELEVFKFFYPAVF